MGEKGAPQCATTGSWGKRLKNVCLAWFYRCETLGRIVRKLAKLVASGDKTCVLGNNGVMHVKPRDYQGPFVSCKL